MKHVSHGWTLSLLTLALAASAVRAADGGRPCAPTFAVAGTARTSAPGHPLRVVRTACDGRCVYDTSLCARSPGLPGGTCVPPASAQIDILTAPDGVAFDLPPGLGRDACGPPARIVLEPAGATPAKLRLRAAIRNTDGTRVRRSRLALVCMPATEADCPVVPPPPPAGPCVVGGCSRQVCADEPVGTTCQWLPEYACYRSARCERQVAGRCAWTSTPELRACLLRNGGGLGDLR